MTPRYARLKASAPNGTKPEVIGWENIELISDRPFETMLAEMKQLKQEYPDRILIASIMEEYNRDAWEEIIERVEETGVVSWPQHSVRFDRNIVYQFLNYGTSEQTLY